MRNRYPRQLSYGSNNPVIVISEKEAGKIFSGDTRSDIGSEAAKMKFANTINSLVCKFIRIDFDEKNNWELLVMERIYALDYRSYEVEKRELWVDVFEDEIRQLHKAGFVHHDLCRPSNINGEHFDNILLTGNGLRLIDVGISALLLQVGEKLFNKYVEVELSELKKFKDFFLSR
jgi:tRNA A-37 threonylcarbamoyl transferase component Bud32